MEVAKADHLMMVHLGLMILVVQIGLFRVTIEIIAITGASIFSELLGRRWSENSVCLIVRTHVTLVF